MDMGQIHILPPHIANRIAAGEVVERPASIVKELLENAIDSGADSITVELEDGGKSLIRVRDNGCGIAFDDISLAIERHATSKIQDEAGLDAIITLGFRGEALPSIGAVSFLTIQSRPSDAVSGGFVSIRFGRDKRHGPVGCAPGTTVSVEDLFLELPGRRRFLKTNQTELGHISMVMRRLAAAYPHIAMELWHEGRRLFEFKKRAGAMRLEPLAGAALCFKFLSVSSLVSGGYEIEMYLGLPEHAAPNAKSFHFFLNGRPIRDAMLWKAVTEAYKGLLMKNFFPVGGLFLRCDPALVDVNVHPGKHEVRFAEPDNVYRMVYNAVRNALNGESHTQFSCMTASASQTVSVAEHAVFSWDCKKSPGVQEPRQSDWSEVLQQLDSGCVPVEYKPGTPRIESVQPFRIIGQTWHSYIMVEMGSQLLIVDQHAAHEAVVFQRLQQTLEEKTWRLQPLLLPLIIEFDLSQLAALYEVQPLLQELGVMLEPFGPFQAKVTALPDWLSQKADVRRLLQEVIKLLIEDHGSSKRRVLYEHIASMACEDAVQAGHPLTFEEMQSLMQDVLEIGATHCPHGRPIFFQMSRQELEKLLGRR
ncbi:MAG: DNA mismatch repair endonuclease MutL [Dissulfuribacterales bacterium]